MASENQDILARISQLAGELATPLLLGSQLIHLFSGKINRHKNDQTPDSQGRPMPPVRTNSYPSEDFAPKPAITATDIIRGYPQVHPGWKPSRGGHSSRGYRGGKPPAVHRNRTLVLNSGTSTPPTPDAIDMDNQSGANFTSNTSNTGPSWVTKQDRHLQLINTSIFEKDSQSRAKAIEETRKQKMIEREAREKAKLTRHLHRVAAGVYNGGSAHTRSVSTPSNYEINVQGIQFRVAKNGSKLVKTPGERLPIPTAYERDKFGVQVWSLPCAGDLNAAKSTPKTALVGGVRFHRSKNGNMYRSGIIKAHRYEHPYTHLSSRPTSCGNTNQFTVRRNVVVKKINEPCKMFTTTGTSISFKSYSYHTISKR